MKSVRVDKSKCSVLGCNDPHIILHRPPSTETIRSSWMDFIYRGNVPTNVPKAVFVCANHFEEHCFTNLRQFEEGFAERLRLKGGAVPSIYPLVDFCIMEHLEDTKPQLSLSRLEPKGLLDVGCQTERVLTKHAFVQAQVKPLFRSKAIQARAPCRSVECSANFPLESPEISQGKRRRCEGSDGISSSFCTVESDNNSRTSKEAPPQKSQFIVEEDKLMELFVWCPVCSNNCDVSKSMTKTLLLVKQRCTHCHFTNEWSSHSKPS